MLLGAQLQTSAAMDAVHHDVILTSILPCLDGPALASLSCTSTTLRDLIDSNSHRLWLNICYDTWPSVLDPRIRHFISTFPPAGPRSFFSQSYASQLRSTHFQRCSRRLTEFISAVDLRYKGNVIFSKMAETTDTETSWFRNSPFRVDMIDQKDVVQTSTFKHPTTDEACDQLSHDLTLSWIVIDPVNARAANLSSVHPVSVHRHWLSGEVTVEFCSVLVGEKKNNEKVFGRRSADGAAEVVKCGMRVTLGGAEEGGEMEVREVSLVMEDIDGKHLNGEGSLVILEGGLDGNKMRKYEEFLERKRLRKENELRREQRQYRSGHNIIMKKIQQF
ncbi:hypothetical protein QQ045_021616 [Rhodiola kirilowii]